MPLEFQIQIQIHRGRIYVSVAYVPAKESKCATPIQERRSTEVGGWKSILSSWSAAATAHQ